MESQSMNAANSWVRAFPFHLTQKKEHFCLMLYIYMSPFFKIWEYTINSEMHYGSFINYLGMIMHVFKLSK